METWIRDHLARRPWWMNVLLVFSAFMAFVYVPWDLFLKPLAQDEQVWFGLRFHGWTAKLLTLPHWAIYAAGTVGFWRMARWMSPWAAVYVGQVAFAMLVWNLLYVGGLRGLVSGVVSGAFFAAIAFALHREREAFEATDPPLQHRYGDWALVTGASAGIGTAFAHAIARDGMNVVLVARREDRLDALAREIEDRHQVAARVVAADLTEPGAAEQVLAAVHDLEIGLLVNNAGFGYAGRMDAQDPKRLRAMVQLHCMVPVELTSAFLPAMRARGRGGVIFTGSVSGCQPLPRHALYSATKAFDNLLGEALWGELQGSGVDVLALEPGATVTEFSNLAGQLPHGGDTPEDVVEAALEALGRQPSVIPGWGNWLRANAGMRLLPRSLLALAAGRVSESWNPSASD